MVMLSITALFRVNNAHMANCIVNGDLAKNNYYFVNSHLLMAWFFLNIPTLIQ
jgi:hypothetical protein